jgi:hypothetical protein
VASRPREGPLSFVYTSAELFSKDEARRIPANIAKAARSPHWVKVKNPKAPGGEARGRGGLGAPNLAEPAKSLNRCLTEFSTDIG